MPLPSRINVAWSRLQNIDVIYGRMFKHASRQLWRYGEVLSTCRLELFWWQCLFLDIIVGGRGKVYVPGQDHICAGEYGYFWRGLRQSMADSESHVQYMECLGPLEGGLRNPRDAWTKVRNGTATPEDISFMKQYYENTFNGEYSQTFVEAARVTLMFFEGNTWSNWSYAPPPSRYPSFRSGEVNYNFLPFFTTF